jgi:hypothetical protein
MSRYEMSTPRTFIALAAAALTAVTMGVAVVVPATADPGEADTRALTMAGAAARAPIEVTILTAPVEVIGYRHRDVAASQEKAIRPVRAPQG